MKSPLAGVRILTLENFGAGPFGTMYLADLGAEVIKVEPPGHGDQSRGMGPYYLGDDDSEYFQSLNLNKKSVTIDMKSPEGREAFRRLAGTADAVVNNLRGDQPAKLGITYAQLKDVNPRLVCAHISAYGRDNERTAWPGYDYLMQAEAGYFHVTGEPGTPPTRMGLSIVDFMTGITGMLGLVSSILGAQRTGTGGDVDVCLFDVALHQLSYPGTWYLNQGLVTGRLPRSSHPSAVPVQLYRTKDGWIFLMCMNQKFWQALVGAIGREDLGGDPRFATMAARRENRDALTGVLDDILSQDTTEAWLAKLRSLLPAAPVYDMAQALENPHVHEVGMVRSTPHPLKPELRTFASPLKLDGERPEARVCSALGADTDAVLRAAGYSADEIAALRAAGAI